MKPMIYRQKRWRDGKHVESPAWRGRFRIGAEKLSDVPLKTTDKVIAWARLLKIVHEREYESVGLGPSVKLRESATRELREHLEDFATDRDRVGRAETYCRLLRGRVGRLIDEAGWQSLKDVSGDSFRRWRDRQCGRSAKTLNEYLNAACALFNWMVKQGRITVNPLTSVQKISVVGQSSFKRRAFSVDEAERLLRVADERRPVYLTAIYTGLRFGEIRELMWGDLYLDVAEPYILARASTTKNRKEAFLPLVKPAHVLALKALRDEKAGQSDFVFDHVMHSEKTFRRMFRKDLEQAQIPIFDEKARRVDFHSLRYTCATFLFLAGAAPRVVQAIMRHSELRLTTNIYTDVDKLPLRVELSKMPDFPPTILSQAAALCASIRPSSELISTGGVAGVPASQDASLNASLNSCIVGQGVAEFGHEKILRSA